MTHGTRDWDVTAGSRTTHKLTDMGELAARLGSPMHYDRRGDVIWIDSFEEQTNRYDTSTGGTGAAVHRSAERAQSGRYSMKLIAGSDGGQFSTLIASTPDVVRSKVGFELSFNLPTDIDTLDFFINVQDGVNSWAALVEWSDTNKQLLLLDDTNTLVVLANNIALPIDRPTWNTIKLVADLQAHTYERLLLNALAYDLGGRPMYTAAYPPAPRVNYLVILSGRAGHNDVAYLDHLIITQNEP